MRARRPSRPGQARPRGRPRAIRATSATSQGRASPLARSPPPTERVQLVRRDGRDVSTSYGREGGGGAKRFLRFAGKRRGRGPSPPRILAARPRGSPANAQPASAARLPRTLCPPGRRWAHSPVRSALRSWEELRPQEQVLSPEAPAWKGPSGRRWGPSPPTPPAMMPEHASARIAVKNAGK